MRRLAIRSALSDKVANEKLIVLNDLFMETPRTKDMLALLDRLPLADKGKRVLMMLPQRDENVILSIRNIPTAKAQHVSSINVVELLKHDCLIMPVKTVRWLEMVFGEGLSAEEASARITDEELDESTSESATTDDEELDGHVAAFFVQAPDIDVLFVRRSHLLLGLHKLVAGDRALGRGGLLEAVVGGLGGGELGLGLDPLGLGGLDFGFG